MHMSGRGNKGEECGGHDRNNLHCHKLQLQHEIRGILTPMRRFMRNNHGTDHNRSRSWSPPCRHTVPSVVPLSYYEGSNMMKHIQPPNAKPANGTYSQPVENSASWIPYIRNTVIDLAVDIQENPTAVNLCILALLLSFLVDIYPSAPGIYEDSIEHMSI